MTLNQLILKMNATTSLVRFVSIYQQRGSDIKERSNLVS